MRNEETPLNQHPGGSQVSRSGPAVGGVTGADPTSAAPSLLTPHSALRTRVALLGSTGSIGRQVLDVAARFPERLQIVSLTARTDLEALLRQIAEVRPRM